MAVAVVPGVPGAGSTTPFVMTLGDAWVDTFRPQDVAWFILNELPVAMIMGGGAFATYFALDRRSPPPLMLPSVTQVTMALWMTATLLWAELPDRAWVKWDWAFKAMVFAAFVPLVIRSRRADRGFRANLVFSLAANFVPFGLKGADFGWRLWQNLGLASWQLGPRGRRATFDGVPDGGAVGIVLRQARAIDSTIAVYERRLWRRRDFGGDHGHRHLRTQRADRDGGFGHLHVHTIPAKICLWRSSPAC